MASAKGGTGWGGMGQRENSGTAIVSASAPLTFSLSQEAAGSRLRQSFGASWHSHKNHYLHGCRGEDVAATPGREVMGRNEPEPGLRGLGTGSGLTRPPHPCTDTGGRSLFSRCYGKFQVWGERSRGNRSSLLLPCKRSLSPVLPLLC